MSSSSNAGSSRSVSSDIVGFSANTTSWGGVGGGRGGWRRERVEEGKGEGEGKGEDGGGGRGRRSRGGRR